MSNGQRHALQQLAMRATVLVVDGLGDVDPIEHASDAVATFVETVIWSRFSGGLPTIVTTPMTTDQVVFRYGRATAHAVFGGTIIQLDPDYDWHTGIARGDDNSPP